MHPLPTRSDSATTPLAALGAAKPDVRTLTHRRYPVTYRPDIDGLRALAIIAVVLFHAFPSLMPGGFVGVDVFFVISGFLISGILSRALQNGTFSFAAFYANRIRRLFPALLLLLAVCLVVGWFVLLPDEYERLGKHTVGAAAYIENFVLRRETGYFDVRSIFKPLMHLWSLGIEEQFYLTYPLFLWAMWRIRRSLFLVLVAIAITSFALNVAMVGHDAAGAFFLPQTRCWELAVGCAIACWQLQREEQSPAIKLFPDYSAFQWLRANGARFANSCAAVGTVLIVVATLWTHETDAFPGWWALLPVCGTALVIVAGPEAWINRSVFANSAIVFVGLISYPLYLWHWPMLAFPRMISGGEVSVMLRVVVVILSVALAWATFRFVESPIRFGRKDWVRPVSLVAVSVILACIGYAAKRDGFVSRFPAAVQDLGQLRSVVWSTPECRAISGLKIDYCRTTSAKSPDVLLFGDSHAAVLYDGLAPHFEKRSITLMNLGEAGCAPFHDTQTFSPGQQDKDCKTAVNAQLNFTVHAASVHTVILSARGPRYMSGEGFGPAESAAAPKMISRQDLPDNAAQPEIYARALRDTLSVLTISGKKVVLFLDWPELGFDPRSCLERPIRFSGAVRQSCAVPRAEVDARNHDYRELVFQMKQEFSGIEIFDPVPSLCDSSACYGLRDGRLLYSDDTHVSVTGANYLAGKYFEEVH